MFLCNHGGYGSLDLTMVRYRIEHTMEVKLLQVFRISLSTYLIYQCVSLAVFPKKKYRKCTLIDLTGAKQHALGH